MGAQPWPHVDCQSFEAPQGACLHELFEAQADARGDATALICGAESLSYAELEIRANRLAHHLRRLGAGPNVLVALCLEHSELPIIAILACLKAGGAYVPIDPAFPDDRIRHIVAEAEIAVLLTQKHLVDRVSKLFGGRIVALDACNGEIESEPAGRLARSCTGVKPEDVCYVLYTSGTTGRPKGIVTEHRNVTHFVAAFNAVCTTRPDDIVFQGFSLGFDGSVEEIWMAFSNGAALVVGTKETPRFGNELARYLATAGVTYFSTVPTMLSTMTEDVPSLRQLVVSGEICPPELVARWAREGRRMLNAYGPTEATVNTTVALCEPGRPITIGRPLEGYTTLILDTDMQPVPPGSKGELYIGGITLARGYLKQPELTARSFIGNCSATRLYRTGDLARVNEEGEIEFFGRIDSQVKIRGYRVELSEIESVLLEQEQIASAAVRLCDREGAPCLAAYVVLNGAPATLDRGQVLESLRARLPSYMVPAYLESLDALPMLTSGKIDRTRLPQPVSALVSDASESSKPETPLEAQIADVWAAVFRVRQVGAEQDFFLDLGGHSLLAAQMVASLRTRAGAHIAVRDVYAFPTVRKLSEHIEKQRSAAASSLERQIATAAPTAPRKPSFALMVAQPATILLLLFALMLPLAVVIPAIADTFYGRTPILSTAAYLTCFFLMLWPVMLAISIGGKWLIIGRYRPGAYPLWGSYYFRWWLVSRLQALSGAGIFIGTPLMPLYYRLMGARVGRNCALDTALCSIWDLVSVGDDTSIGTDTQLLGCRIENGYLVIGRVDIGSRCFIGLHSALGLDVKMGDDARLDDQSLLPDGGHIPAGEARRGSPARKAKVEAPEGDPRGHSRLRIGLFAVAQLVSAFVLSFVMSLPGLAITLLMAYAIVDFIIDKKDILFILVAPPLFVVVCCLWIAAVKAVVLPRARPGIYDLHTIDDLRYWLAAGVMRASRSMLLPLFTTLYLPPWMRLLGARIGKYSEMSTIFSFLPDLLTTGDGSFFADGSILGGRRTNRGRFEVGANHVGRSAASEQQHDFYNHHQPSCYTLTRI